MTIDTTAFRLLPSVEELIHSLPEHARGSSHDVRVEHARACLEAWRARVQAGELDAAALQTALEAGELSADLEGRLAREERRGLVSVVNATGVVLNTGLGRAPVHPEAAAAMARVAQGYCVLEVDRDSGERNERDGRVSELLGRLTGAEAAIAVNNNAAATYLVLSTFAWGGRQVVVSRGELVEIGGSFRMPDVMARAAVELREVGTTNRTRIGDYRAAVGEDTGLLLKVHTSNYRVEGFTEEVQPAELASLGRELGIPTAYDLGSGRLELEGALPLDFLGDEPLVRACVESGLDVVTFSGDKLLGGPQAGLIVGTSQAVAKVRQNPIYRAMRLDKVGLAGLETTLELYLTGRADEIPARERMLLPAAQLEAPARALAGALEGLGGLRAEARVSRTQPGSGSAPGVFLDTWAVRVQHDELSPGRLAARLRRGDPAVFARVQDEALWIDLRTLLPGEDELVRAAFAKLG